jgi:RNA-directed DNA polymerase
MVNGPEGLLLELDAAGWESIDWRRHEEEVRRLRGRIFKTAQEGDWPKVRNLQRLLLRSRSNTLLSVRQVTQRNAGRKTAGIDGEVALTSQARAEVVVRVHATARSWQPRAVKRVYIPKSGNEKKLRPRGIPVIGGIHLAGLSWHPIQLGAGRHYPRFAGAVCDRCRAP